MFLQVPRERAAEGMHMYVYRRNNEPHSLSQARRMMLLPQKERQYIRDGLKRMKLNSLNEYHSSVIWAAKRTAVGNRKKRICKCGETRFLNLHHKTYKNIGSEHDDELEYLCGPCHEKEHARWTQKIIRDRKNQFRKTTHDYKVEKKLRRQRMRFNDKIMKRMWKWIGIFSIKRNSGLI